MTSINQQAGSQEFCSPMKEVELWLRSFDFGSEQVRRLMDVWSTKALTLCNHLNQLSWWHCVTMLSFCVKISWRYAFPIFQSYALSYASCPMTTDTNLWNIHNIEFSCFHILMLLNCLESIFISLTHTTYIGPDIWKQQQNTTSTLWLDTPWPQGSADST